MQKESEGAVLFAATVLAVGLVALAGSLDYNTPTGFAIGTPPSAGNNCNTTDKETACVGYNVDCLGSYCRTKISGAKTGDKCGPVSATEWVECAEGICLGQETFWAKKAIHQRAGRCFIPHSIERK
ncbi:MAG: hypothetical protein HY363_00840 [Candidatus Aenigmarchaeota archaeon]|nr:hypothetical protein [Candidatus Aenigmarchaeota archaeon]